VFPVFVKPEKLDAAVSLQLNLFFAVCKDICIPAKAKTGVALEASATSPLLDEWQKRLPRPAVAGDSPFVTAAHFETRDNKPALVVSLTGQAQDLFVESETSAYFGKPRFDSATGEAWLPIANLRDTAKLRGVPLKLTLSTGESGIEQTFTIN
jgi:DsbC/DsbD-like thiol-disulfide interchange protein